MLPTHALVGLLLALPFALGVPEFGSVALVASFIGGVFPDLDMYVGHRRTLHYPVYFPALAVATVPAALLFPSTATVAAAFLLLGAAVHSFMDIFGGGLELRPWEATSDRAVYDHHRDRWVTPRRWVRYDGAPKDLLLSVTVAVPSVLLLDGVLWWVVLSTLAVAVGYTLIRRALPAVAELLVDRFFIPTSPDWVLAYVPARYLNDERDRPIGYTGSD